MKKAFALLATATALGIFVRTGALQHSNLAVLHAFQSAQPSWLVEINRTISSLELFIIAAVPLLFVFLRFKRKSAEANIVLVAGLSWFVMRALKTVFDVTCPTANQAQLLFTYRNVETAVHTATSALTFLDPSACYPSGHTFDFVVLLGSIALVRTHLVKQKWIQRAILAASVILILLIGQSRISLGAHWPTDVVGGYLFGFGWLLILRAWYFRARSLKSR